MNINPIDELFGDDSESAVFAPEFDLAADREKRVGELTRAVEAGQYHPEAEAVADAILLHQKLQQEPRRVSRAPKMYLVETVEGERAAQDYLNEGARQGYRLHTCKAFQSGPTRKFILVLRRESRKPAEGDSHVA